MEETEHDARPAATERADRPLHDRARSSRRREKFPLLVELEPLFQCNLACAGCGKIQHPEHVLRAAHAGRAGDRRDRGVRRADGLDRGRRAADPPGDRRDRPPADRAQEVRLPVHQRAADGAEDGPLQAVAVLRLGGPHRRPARAPRRVGLPRRRVRQGGRRDPRGASSAASASRPTPRSSPTTRRRRCVACSTSSTTSSRSTR